MRALLGKELRGALPLALLWWLVWASSLLENGVFGAPDMVSFTTALDAWDEPSMTVLLGGTVSLWLAGMLVQAEHAGGTMEFLDALPTSRTCVFAAKVAAGLLLLWSGPALQLGIALGFDAASRPSPASAPPAGIVVPWLALTCVQMSVLFAVSVLLSFLRRFQWLAAALLLLTFLALVGRVPSLRVFDVSALADPAVVGRTLEVPWRLLAAQVPLAAACLGAAWVLYRGAGDRLLEFGARLGDSALGRAAIVAVTALTVVLWVAVPAILVAGDGDDDAPEDGDPAARVVYASWSRSRATTRCYTFTYPSSLEERAAELVARADTVHDRVAEYFEAQPIGRIDVDATGAGPAMYAGRAFHEAMQLDLPGAESPEDLLAVLGHETAHLYIDAVSDRRLLDEFRWCRAVHEGLANHVEHALLRPREDLDAVRLSAALAHAWKPVEFESFLDDEALSAERDPYLVYTVGEVLVAALADVHGERAPVRLLRAYGRSDRPQDVKGLARWRDAFQAAGYDMERVAARFLAMLDEEKARFAAVVQSLPRLRGRLTERTDEDGTSWVGVTPVAAGTVPDGWEVVVRFRRAPTDGMDEYLHAHETADGAFEVARTSLPGRRASYQIGLASRTSGAGVWEVWKEAALSR